MVSVCLVTAEFSFTFGEINLIMLCLKLSDPKQAGSTTFMYRTMSCCT